LKSWAAFQRREYPRDSVREASFLESGHGGL